MKRIAVVEDEVYMREELCDMLQKDGYLVEAITEFEDAARLLAALRPDLVILDLNLPEISGFQICQELKNKTAIPVLVLTSRDQVKDELQAFQLGADEYLTKPCRKDRLLARVSNILKRYEGRTNLIEGPDFLLDQQTYTLYIHNTSVVLPKNQGKLLVALLSGGDALVTTEQLCMALWGTTEYIDENALQVMRITSVCSSGTVCSRGFLPGIQRFPRSVISALRTDKPRSSISISWMNAMRGSRMALTISAATAVGLRRCRSLYPR